jgi:tetratricopeptide (TPR) repeat protein
MTGVLSSCQPKKQGENNPTISQIICRTQLTDKDWYKSGKKAPLFEGLGNVHYPITTQSKEAQRYFDQGLMLAMGFNHAESARSFYQATKIDSTCAMAFWGFAFVLGPNYNAGMEPDNYARAYKAVKQAEKLSGSCTAKEKMLIRALSKRYPQGPVEDRKPYDVAYSEVMKNIYRQFPNDENVAVLYVESVMDLHPWDLWEKSGQPKPWTKNILAELENLKVRFPKHIGIQHYYIHVIEASPTPEKGLASAAILTSLAPNASHLVHMPSHIYIHTGNYHEASLANIHAVKVDSAYLKGCYAQGAFPLMYFPHNYHLLAATATMEGNQKWAMLAANKMAEYSRKNLMPDTAWSTLQHYYTIRYHVALKFSLWDEIIKMNNTDSVKLKYPIAIRHYAMGRVFVAKNQVGKAKLELSELEKITADPEISKLTSAGINPLNAVLEIAGRVLKAEIAAKVGDVSISEKLLREAVALEDKLNYNEPPDWFFSVRHDLGSLLLKEKKYDEAEKVLLADLNIFPRNIWALKSLYKAQVSKGEAEGARQTKVALNLAGKWADKNVKVL